MFRFSSFMEKKSEIIGLPVVSFNQSKHSDVCQYLEYLQAFITDVYKQQVVSMCNLNIRFMCESTKTGDKFI